MLGARSGLSPCFGTKLQYNSSTLGGLHYFIVFEKLVEKALALTWLLVGERELFELSRRLRIFGWCDTLLLDRLHQIKGLLALFQRLAASLWRLSIGFLQCQSPAQNHRGLLRLIYQSSEVLCLAQILVGTVLFKTFFVGELDVPLARWNLARVYEWLWRLVLRFLRWFITLQITICLWLGTV